MDEATANIDQHTDSLIQDVVRNLFRGKTVIMVAHRLNTVIDCDQVWRAQKVADVYPVRLLPNC